MNTKTRVFFLAGVSLLLVRSIFAQGTIFTYQGRLAEDSAPASGIYEMKFAIYDASTAGNSVAGSLTNSAVMVTNGIFFVPLDFGTAAFDGSNRWLEIGVKPAGPGDFTTLTPRQLFTSTPYAIQALTAEGVTAGAVTGAMLSNNVVTTEKILDGTVTVADLNLTETDGRYVKRSGDEISGSLVVSNNITVGGLVNLNSASITSTDAPLVSVSAPSNSVNYLVKIQPHDFNAYAGTFNLNQEGIDFNGVHDNVMTLGWNQSAGGQAQIAGRPAIWLQWENYFQQSPDQAQSEFHFDYVDINGNSDRPFHYSLDSTNLHNWVLYNAVSSVQYRSPMDGYSNTWMMLAPGQYKFYNDARDRYFYLSTSGNDFVLSAQGGSANLDMQGFSSIAAPGVSLASGTIAFSAFLNSYNNRALTFYTGNGSGPAIDIRPTTGVKVAANRFIGFSATPNTGAINAGDVGLRQSDVGELAVTNASFGYGDLRANTIHSANLNGRTNLAQFDIVETDFIVDQIYTNDARRATVLCSVILSPGGADTAQIGLLIDQTGDGVYDTTLVASKVGSTTTYQEQLLGYLQPGAIFVFSNMSSGFAAAGIVAGSCQWVKQ